LQCLQACRAAHADLRPASLSWAEGEVLDANINRSPTAYNNNPAEERAQYKHDVDKDMTVLRIQTADGKGR
jgi:neutral ceramidase